jgi:penicillin-binding protein 1C
MRKSWHAIKRFFYRFRYWFGGLFLIFFIWYLQALPEHLFTDPVCTVVKDRDGNILAARIADDGQWRFPHNENVPEKFEKAVVQFEDRNFYSHWGVSFRGFARAIKQNTSEGRVVSGGSTITMQVMRLSRKGKSRNIWNKTVEAILATRLEWSYSKEEILALWSSNAPMGGNVVGLDAAAWRYFGRTPDQLSWAEAVTLAVLPNAPSLIYPGKNQFRLKEKRDRVLDGLYENGEMDSITWVLSKAEPLPQAPPDLDNIAPHLTDRLMKEGKKGTFITTTINKDLQKQVNKILIHHQKKLMQNEVYNAACIIIHIPTGEVLAYAGNVRDPEDENYKEHGTDVDVIVAPRSTGSILKPFLYAGMVNDGLITPKMIVPDIPTHISGYSPKNFSQKYDGMVPADRALSRSLNIPIVRMLQQYGVAKFLHLLKKLGLTTLHRTSQNYGLSLVLGGAEASLWDLASVYTKMGKTMNQYPDFTSELNEGPHFILEGQGTRDKGQGTGSKINPPLDPAAIYVMLQAMVEVNRPDMEANWNLFQSTSKISWKTGTSFGFRDAWAIGLNKEYVVAVWAGNADGEGRPGLTGIESAAPILFDVFNRLPKAGWFVAPYDDMQEAAICRMSGHRATELCEEVDTVQIPLTSLNTNACPYHQIIHLDKTKKYRVDLSCESIENMVDVKWFVLPPVMEFYYKTRNPNYHSLPEVRSDCITESENKPMEIIYPKKKSKIYIPIDIDGTRGKTVLEVAHRSSNAEIHWHLDENYIGTTTTIHQLEVSPKAGKHKLMVIDADGFQTTVEFDIEEKFGGD